jgi:hypothetical protein
MEILFPYVASLLGFLAVYVLNGIKGEIKEVKTTVQSLENDLRGGMNSLDRRITRIESTCAHEHNVTFPLERM